MTAQPSDPIDTVYISVSRQLTMHADRAYVHLSIKGSSFVSGRMALTKAREVANLVRQLQVVGVTDEEIEVTGIAIDVSSGLMSKSSEASYSLRIECRSLEMMPDVLGAISAQKTANMVRVEWRYPAESETRTQLLVDAIEEASAKAKRIAAALGVDLLGVRSFREATPAFDAQDVLYDSEFALSRARRATPVDLGTNINHSKSLEVHIDVEYRIGEFKASGG